MRTALALALGLALAQGLTAGGNAVAASPFGEELAPADLETQRGGADIHEVSQSNQTAQNGSNSGTISIGGNATKTSGTIGQAMVNGNNGITTVLQNTGDLVNMNNATSVNIFMQ